MAKAPAAKTASKKIPNGPDGVKRGPASLLPRDAADPPLRGARRTAVRHGSDRRGSATSISARKPWRWASRPASNRALTRSSPAIATTATCCAAGMDPESGHGRADRAHRRLVQGQGRVDAHVRHRRRPFTAATASSGRRWRWAPAWRSRASTAAMTRWPSSILATARPTRARSMRASTWPSCGSCRPSTSSRTTSTPWARAIERSSSTTELYRARLQLRHPRRTGRRHGCAGGARRDGPGREARARRRRALHPRDEDLSLSRPFDERSGQVPDQGGGRRGQEDPRPDRPCETCCSTQPVPGRTTSRPIEDEVKAIVAESVQFAQESPEPDPSELYTDVYQEA
jgi:hypothetical protein